MSDFVFRPDAVIRWSTRGSCGNAGCTDPQCCCAVCNKPIGVPDDDPRWEEHDEWCGDCDLCRDQVPIMLFHGEGRTMVQAQFHIECFNAIVEWPSVTATDPQRWVQ